MGGQSHECKMCGKWFLSKGAAFDHAKSAHRSSHLYPDANERQAYNRAFARGWWGDAMEKRQGYPNAYGRGYWEGVYVADPHGATK